MWTYLKASGTIVRLLHELGAAVNLVHHRLTKLELQMTAVQDALDDLKAKVAAEKDVEDSAILLLQGLKKALDDAIFNSGNTIDPQVLKDLSAQIGAETENLAAAVAANPVPAPASVKTASAKAPSSSSSTSA